MNQSEAISEIAKTLDSNNRATAAIVDRVITLEQGNLSAAEAVWSLTALMEAAVDQIGELQQRVRDLELLVEYNDVDGLC